MEALPLILPTLIEAWSDRHGETAKDKRKDALIAAIVWLAFALTYWWLLDIHPLKTLVLLAGIRIMFFDYLVQYLLIKNGVISGHWFYYQGKTAKWDRVLAYLNPWIVLTIRVLIFSGTVFIFYY